MSKTEQIGRKIRELRTNKGVSQQQLGKLLERSHAAISDIERGKTELTVKDLYTIAGIFEISVDVLLIPEKVENSKSFIMNRFDKDVTHDEKKKADKAEMDFEAHVMQLAKQINDSNSK